MGSLQWIQLPAIFKWKEVREFKQQITNGNHMFRDFNVVW